MLLINQPGSKLDEPWSLVHQLIENARNGSIIGQAYSQELSEIYSHWAQDDRGTKTIGQLPLLTCQAAGGNHHQAVAILVAWQLLRLAAKLLDDVEDGEVTTQQGQATNSATGFLFLAQLALWMDSGLARDHVRQLHQSLNRAGLLACSGQHAELADLTGITVRDPNLWLQIALAKSGEPLGWAAWAGALVAGADEATQVCYREYGYHLGVLLQVADDFTGIWHPSDPHDLTARRITLPVAYALFVAKEGERELLETLLGQAALGGKTAQADARELLTRAGAQSYLAVVAQVQRQQAVEALQRARGLSPWGQTLVELLDGIMPILNCVEKVTL